MFLAAVGASLVLATALITYINACRSGQPAAIEIEGERLWELCGGWDGTLSLVGGLLSLFGGMGLLAWCRRGPLE